MDLSKDQHAELLKSIKSYMDADELYTYTVEFVSPLLRADMDDTIRRLIYQTEYGGFGCKYTMSTELEITLGDTFARVDNKNAIKKYWLDGDLPKLKARRRQEIEALDLEDFGLKFHLDREEETTVKVDEEDGDREYIYKNKYLITPVDDTPLTIVFSTIKKGTGTSFRSSKALGSDPTYQLSFEFNRSLQGSKEDVDLDAVIAQIVLVTVLVQGGYQLQRVSRQDSVRKSFHQLVEYKEGGDYHSLNVLSLPVAMQRKNLVEGNGINVLNDYAFSLQPHGEAVMVYINDDDKNRDSHGLVYLIDAGLNFYPTDIQLPKLAGTLIQGTWVRSLAAVFMSDLLWDNGKDVRKRHLNVRRGKPDKCRINYLREAVKTIVDHESIVSFRIMEYKCDSGEKLFSTINDLWTKKDAMEYAVEGIIFTPIRESYPEKGGIWEQQLIWRPPGQNYINFLVTAEKDDDGTDIISPLLVEGSERLEQYKTLELHVGASESEYDNTEKRWNRDYVSKLFNPFHQDDLDAQEHNHATVLINSNHQMLTMSPYTGQQQTIRDDYIVSMAYDINAEHFKWKPIAVDLRTTERYSRGDPGYYFPERLANRTWESMIQPVTTDMIISGVIVEAKPFGQEGGALSKLDLAETRYPYQNFHRLVVNRLLLQEVALDRDHMTGDLIDFACGRGSDVINWKHAKFANVVSLDINKPCINYAKEFYKRFESPKPTAHYIWADASQLIFPKQRAGLNKLAKIALREYLPSKWIFDVATLEYSLPYYFENEEKLRGLMQNLNDCLKIGGKVVGTSLDGQRVFSSLKGKKMSGWIKKGYTAKKFPTRLPNYGMKIFVERDDEINYEEFLVNFTYLDKIMREYGFEQVRVDGFSSYEPRMSEVPPELQEISAMTDEEKLFSFLHNTFIYQKVRHSSERLYRNLIKMNGE